MSKVAIAGNASGTGTFTIAAPNSNTDRTLTLPDEAGTVLTSVSSLPAANLSGSLPAGMGGKVLQVVQNTYAVETTSTSSSYVSTGLSGSITPSSSSSKILVIAYTGARTNYTNILTLFRGTVSGTNLGNGNSGMVLMYTGGDIRSAASVQYLDSPATTSSQTYTLAMRSSNGTTIIAQENNGQAGIILMEIAA